MTIFIRLLREHDKEEKLKENVAALRSGQSCSNLFEESKQSFCLFPGQPLVYWAPESAKVAFRKLPRLETDGRKTCVGVQTSDDFRFVRTWWEVDSEKWVGFVKGGAYSPYYCDTHLVLNWAPDGSELKAWAGSLYDGSHWTRIIKNSELYLEPGITWPTRPHKRGGFSFVPPGQIFSNSGTMLFSQKMDYEVILPLLNSDPFIFLLHLLMPRGGDGSGQTLKYELGYVGSVPFPDPDRLDRKKLETVGRRLWHLHRSLDEYEETSHVFRRPQTLSSHEHIQELCREIASLQSEVNDIAYRLYGFSSRDRLDASRALSIDEFEYEGDIEESNEPENSKNVFGVESQIKSWAVGVAFGRFSLPIAPIGPASAEPDLFTALPAKSAGMLPDSAQPFHEHAGILVDDASHYHDITRLTEAVLAQIDAVVSSDVHRWLQRDFFPFHLQRYSKSRRKAPIYWPLSTTSGSYTLWIYYPSLTSQTLYTAINDFVEPKLKEVGADGTALRNKGTARTRDEEKQFETLQAFELELIDLRDTLLKLAPTYKPNHDDGVQISAAPLWPLFRHKPWQKVLKDTWAKLEKGEYDWAHLAMNYWPDRVREKCKTDKSLAIAHRLENLYIEPEAAPKKARKKKAGGDE